MNNKKNKTYEVKARCNNCHLYLPINITKGIKVSDFKIKNVCPNCGCFCWYDK